MAKYQVAVLGCGSIFSRHLAALKANPEHYDFIAYYDPNPITAAKYASELVSQRLYQNEEEAYNDPAVNCVVLLTPSHLHYTQAKKAIASHKQWNCKNLRCRTASKFFVCCKYVLIIQLGWLSKCLSMGCWAIFVVVV